MRKAIVLGLMTTCLVGCGGGGGGGSSFSSGTNAATSAVTRTSQQVFPAGSNGTTVIGQVSAPILARYENDQFLHTLNLIEGAYPGYKTMHSFSIPFDNFALVPEVHAATYNISALNVFSGEAHLHLKTSFDWKGVKFSPEGALFLRSFSYSVFGDIQEFESGFSFKMKAHVSENLSSAFHFAQTYRKFDDQSQAMLEFSARF